MADCGCMQRAAVRKLEHELGIMPQELPLTDFHFLTRLHYCAADTDTYGPDAEWGEHEVRGEGVLFSWDCLLAVTQPIRPVSSYFFVLQVDYILFIKAAVSLKPNAEEVEDTRFVTLPELKDMMAPSSPLRWSPWFRIIAENFLEEWWTDLDKAISTDAYLDVKSIHKIL